MEDHKMTETKPATYIIDTHKIEKYLPRLINGEAYQLEKWLPNLIATGKGFSGAENREHYDWRTTQFRKKDPASYNTKIAAVIRQLETLRQNKQNLIAAIADFKVATDTHFEKGKQL
jgi:hypothetical protein